MSKHNNVLYIEYSNEVTAARYYRTYEMLDKSMNYYTPYGHNTFIGDVANFYHNGVYHLDGPWEPMESFPFECFDNSPMRDTDECPSFFELNGYKYLIMGVTGFWRAEKDSDVYIECASGGYDVYEGLSVPMAVKISDNRVVMAGWIGVMNWGSMIVHRELIQYNDGNLGMKWMPELFPKIKNTKKADSNGIFLEIERISHYYEVEFEPGNSDVFGVQLIDASGKVCEIKFNVRNKTAQYGTCFEGESADEILPMYEAINTVEQKEYGFGLEPENLPHRCGDFAIANVRYPNGKITVKILIYYFEKNNGTVIDTEIAETRTMITNRGGFFRKNKILRSKGRGKHFRG